MGVGDITVHTPAGMANGGLTYGYPKLFTGLEKPHRCTVEESKTAISGYRACLCKESFIERKVP